MQIPKFQSLKYQRHLLHKVISNLSRFPSSQSTFEILVDAHYTSTSFKQLPNRHFQNISSQELFNILHFSYWSSLFHSLHSHCHKMLSSTEQKITRYVIFYFTFFLLSYNQIFSIPFFFASHHIVICGPGSSVAIATGYGLDGLGIESRWGGETFRTCPDRGPSASCTMGTGLSRG